MVQPLHAHSASLVRQRGLEANGHSAWNQKNIGKACHDCEMEFARLFERGEHKQKRRTQQSPPFLASLVLA